MLPSNTISQNLVDDTILAMQESILSTEFDGKLRRLFLIKCSLCSAPYYAPKHIGRKFCSDKCYRENQKANKKVITITCAWCFTISTRNKVTPSKTGLYFCNRECKENAQRIGGLEAIQPDHYGSMTGRYTYRDIAFEAHGKKCNRCPYDRYEAVLQVHHKDRDRSNCSPENLEVLCPTCHTEDHYLAGDGLYSGGRPPKIGGGTESSTPTFPVQTECARVITIPPNFGSGLPPDATHLCV